MGKNQAVLTGRCKALSEQRYWVNMCEGFSAKQKTNFLLIAFQERSATDQPEVFQQDTQTEVKV